MINHVISICAFGNGFVSNNIRAFVDPDPVCGIVETGPVLEGSNLTYYCTMTGYITTAAAIRNSLAVVSGGSLSWQADAGTPLNSSFEILTNAPVTIGYTGQVNVSKTVSGAVTPAYNCTLEIYFSPPPTTPANVDVTNLTWTCMTDPVYTWCTYVYVSFAPDSI